MAKKMTYADIAEKLSNAYNKYDGALQNATTDAEKNAATLMLKRVSDRMNQLMLDNQAQANEMDQKETAPDSPNQSIAQREMRMGKGGKLKPVPKGKKGKGLSKLPRAVRNKMGFMKDGGILKPIPPDNKGLPMLAKSVRNNMGYMKKGGSTFPDLTGDGKVTQADILKGRGVFQGGGIAPIGDGTPYIIPSLQEENQTIRTLHQSMIKHHHNKIKPVVTEITVNLIGGQVVSIQGLTADYLIFVNELTENKKITLKDYQLGLGKEIK